MSVNQPNSSSQPSNINQATSNQATREQLGVAPDRAGLVLQRGGEELLLTKLPDRFVVQGIPAVINRLMQSQAMRATQGIAPAQLTEFVTHPAALERIMSQVRTLPGVNFVSHVYQLQTSPGSSVYVTNELTVQFTPEGAHQAAAIADALRLSLREPLAGIPDTFIFEVLPLAEANPIKIANYLMRQSFVITAEPNAIIRQQPHYRPRDALYPR
ncbi:MAG: peptidase S8, partial [Cyanobacteria bacterium]|nr:peptidase S8 [Cyanobacteriota bacterium]MDW8202583.1 peptidase S8 [Cyanobacteriota bacterium SKYGB_h_bin112]